MESNFSVRISYNKTRFGSDGTQQVITTINKQNIGAPSKIMLWRSLLQFSEYMN